MSTGQTLLVAAALFLLVRLVLSTNTVFLDVGTMQQQNEAVTTATSLGQGMIERIITRGYDHAMPGGEMIDSVSAFVAISLLGPDPGEVTGHDSTFNDVDDYAGFSDSVSTPRLGMFYRSCRVYYVEEGTPFNPSFMPTFLKRIDVTVSNRAMIDASDPLKLKGPLTVSRIVTYH
jgi:hypothetical protein